MGSAVSRACGVGKIDRVGCIRSGLSQESACLGRVDEL